MQFTSTVTLALALVAGTLLSAALAAPAPQMIASLGGGEQEPGPGPRGPTARRQCVGASASPGREEAQDGRAPDCLGMLLQPRQMLGASMEEGGVEDRQISSHVHGPGSPDE